MSTTLDMIDPSAGLLMIRCAGTSGWRSCTGRSVDSGSWAAATGWNGVQRCGGDGAVLMRRVVDHAAGLAHAERPEHARSQQLVHGLAGDLLQAGADDLPSVVGVEPPLPRLGGRRVRLQAVERA